MGGVATQNAISSACYAYPSLYPRLGVDIDCDLAAVLVCAAELVAGQGAAAFGLQNDLSRLLRLYALR